MTTAKNAYRPVPIDEVLEKLPRKRQSRVRARASEIIAEELALKDLRKLRQVTQEEVAKRLGGRQVYISRLEQRADMKLSTLKSYVEALGGELQLVVTFPEGTAVQLRPVGEGVKRTTSTARSR